MLRRPRKLWASTIVVVVLLVAGWTPVHHDPAIAAQSQQGSGQRIVEIEPMGPNDAVWIQNFIVGAKPIEPNVPFQADGNWLKEMSIVLRNRTDETIDYAAIRFRFPEAGDGKTVPTIIYHLQLGRMPDADRISSKTGQLVPADPDRKPLGFAGGDSLVIHVADYFNDLQNAVEQKIPVAQVTQCVIARGPFYFDNGTRWVDGLYSVPDPARPGYFTDLPVDYFLGANRMKFWPPPWTKRRSVSE